MKKKPPRFTQFHYTLSESDDKCPYWFTLNPPSYTAEVQAASGRLQGKAEVQLESCRTNCSTKLRMLSPPVHYVKSA